MEKNNQAVKKGVEEFKKEGKLSFYAYIERSAIDHYLDEAFEMERSEVGWKMIGHIIDAELTAIKYFLLKVVRAYRESK